MDTCRGGFTRGAIACGISEAMCSLPYCSGMIVFLLFVFAGSFRILLVEFVSQLFERVTEVGSLRPIPQRIELCTAWLIQFVDLKNKKIKRC